jgi:hypothetical protein
MDSVKYIGMDVHKEAISLAVLNSSGKLVDGVRRRNQGQFHSSVRSAKECLHEGRQPE